MNCPRCKAPITQAIDPDSIITCGGCGARLMTRAAARKTQGKGKITDAPPPAPEPASATLESVEKPEGEETRAPDASGAEASVPPAAPESEEKTDPAVSTDEAGPEPPEYAGSSGPVEEAPVAPPPQTSAADLPPSATLPPTPAMLLGTRPEGGDGHAVGPAMLELLLRELQHLRANQERMLELLGQRAPDTATSPAPAEPPEETVLQPVRSRRRKTVLLIDDDPETRAAAVMELEQADIPVRSVDDGNEALRLIAEDKPDVIALELALGGEMAGKDLINTVKATMEWVDIPIVLWTREAVTTQKEARLNHGADELVQKESGTAALATRVITLFRRA